MANGRLKAGVGENEGLVAVQPADVAHQQVQQRREHGDSETEIVHRHHRGELAAPWAKTSRSASTSQGNSTRAADAMVTTSNLPEVDAEVVRNERVVVFPPLNGVGPSESCADRAGS